MSLRDLFLLDPDVTFLNHGSFGATARPVLEVYQAWQRELEREPVDFLARELFDHLAQARAQLGAYVGATPEDVAFIPNTTFGVNIIARSLRLDAGDEILASDHEYGACDNIWSFISHKTGARYVSQPITFPPMSQADVVEQLWAGVTPRTRVIFISHITSQTALQLPVAAVCERARAAGILTIVDGAHAPGQIPVDVEQIGADWYIGNCHKWLMAPKGSAFLYTRPELQHLVEPLVVGWGWGNNAPFDTGSHYLDNVQWWGTHDPAAFLSVPAAIEFQKARDWPSVRRACNALLTQALARIGELTGLPSPYAEHDGVYPRMAPQMGVARLPRIDDLPAFKERLRKDYRIEVPCIEWKNRHFIRVSVQGYNTQTDIDRLLCALESLPPQHG
jgi:isopenicillin-N epimerase